MGLEIGNNNFFHVSNIIFSGHYQKTIIGNDNKFLSNTRIHHDVVVENNIVLYPSCEVLGLSKLLSYSTMGSGSKIQQRMILGQYSMIGMCNPAPHNVFPYFIYAGGEYKRLNLMKIPKEYDIEKYEKDLIKLLNKIKIEGLKDTFLDDIKIFPNYIINDLKNFYYSLQKYKI